MRSIDWIKEIYLVGRIDLDTFLSRLHEIEADLLAQLKEVKDLLSNPPHRDCDK